MTQKPEAPAPKLTDTSALHDDVFEWHIEPLLERLKQEAAGLSDKIQIDVGQLKDVKQLLGRLAGDVDLTDHGDKTDDAIALVIGEWKGKQEKSVLEAEKGELEKLMILAVSGVKWKSSSERFTFQFTTALGCNLQELDDQSKICTYFLWCASLNDQDATFFLVPTSNYLISDLLGKLEPEHAKWSEVKISKENQYWWVKQFGHKKPMTLDLNDWKSEVRFNEYEYVARRILRELGQQDPLVS